MRSRRTDQADLQSGQPKSDKLPGLSPPVPAAVTGNTLPASVDDTARKQKPQPQAAVLASRLRQCTELSPSPLEGEGLGRGGGSLAEAVPYPPTDSPRCPTIEGRSPPADASRTSGNAALRGRVQVISPCPPDSAGALRLCWCAAGAPYGAQPGREREPARLRGIRPRRIKSRTSTRALPCALTSTPAWPRQSRSNGPHVRRDRKPVKQACLHAQRPPEGGLCLQALQPTLTFSSARTGPCRGRPGCARWSHRRLPARRTCRPRCPCRPTRSHRRGPCACRPGPRRRR